MKIVHNPEMMMILNIVCRCELKEFDLILIMLYPTTIPCIKLIKNFRTILLFSPIARAMELRTGYIYQQLPEGIIY